MASAILAIVLAGLLQLFIVCSLLNDANHNLSIAVSHAEFVLEGVRELDFADTASQINAGDWDFLEEDDFTGAGLVRLSGESIDTSVLASGEPLTVSVDVAWNDRQQRPRSLSLQTKITDY